MLKLTCPIFSFSRRTPKKKALIFGEQSLSYNELNYLIEIAKHDLIKQYPEKTLGILGRLTPNTIILYFAALRAKKSVFIFNDKEPTLEIMKKAQELKTSLIDPSYYDFKNKKRAKNKPKLTLNQIASFIFTSGSSNQPKICALSLQNHIKSAKGLRKIAELNHHSNYLLNLPLYHVSGLNILYRAFLEGASCIISAGSCDLSTLVSKYKITHLSLVSTQLSRWINPVNNLNLPSLKMILLGGGPFSKTLLEKALFLGLPIYLSYGLSEMCSTVTIKKVISPESIVGLTLPYRGYFLSKENEIILHGATLFKGYFCPNLKKLIFTGKYFHSKDFGEKNSKEELILIGRKDRRVISGGEKIHPEEIEALLNSFPNILFSYVFFQNKDHDFYHSYAIIKSDTPVSIDALFLYLKEHLPSYKIPKKIFSFPNHLYIDSHKLSFSQKKELECFYSSDLL